MCKMKLIPGVVAFIVLSVSILSQAEYYYVVTYGDEHGDNGEKYIYLKMIDLDSAKVKDKILLARGGNVIEGHPIQLEYHNSTFLFVEIIDGAPAKNAGYGNSYSIYKLIEVDSCLTIANADSIKNRDRDWSEQYPPLRSIFEKGIGCKNKDSVKVAFDKYTINEKWRFSDVDTVDHNVNLGNIRKIHQFEYLQSFNYPNKHNLYSVLNTDWIIRLNSTLDLVVDSLQIKTAQNWLYEYAYRPITDKLYWFQLNYEYHVTNLELEKYYGDKWITPEVYIYDPVSLKLIERDKIADFPKDNFPGMETGLADVVGDYIVVYFFDCELREGFLPAMLFIFDTRTNTARWLNVGWR
jgi:hypothetical protein